MTSGFLDRGNQSRHRSVAFIADVGGLMNDVEEPGLSFSAVRSWVLPGKGCETHARLPVKVQATWRLTPVVWCLPEYSSGCWRQDQHS